MYVIKQKAPNCTELDEKLDSDLCKALKFLLENTGRDYNTLFSKL